jgi:quercetin dioxygenase-like cupin family protein
MNEVKTIKIISAYMFFGILLTLSTNLHAQDILKVGTNLSNKVLLDNDQVRVILVESVPGVVTPWHSHPNYVLYALTDGKLEITEQDKKASVLEFKAGQALYFPAVTHTAKNIGTTTVKIILTELKPAKK